MTRYILLITFALSFISCNINQDKFTIGGDDMYPSFNEGDIVNIDKKDRSFDYGDVVICNLPYLKSTDLGPVIVRIVGLPGDSIQVANGICEINGQQNAFVLVDDSVQIDSNIYNECKETLPNGKTFHVLYDLSQTSDAYTTTTIYIPTDYYFVLADKRGSFFDSVRFGAIPKEKILGKVVEK